MQENSNSNFEVQYITSKRTKFLLMGLLFILNIVIRIPSVSHEKGYDSFFIHSLANSVSNFGVAKWWFNWMSVFGLYPYSYASAVPFTLSGMSQLMGIRMEITVLLFCVILGLFSIFASYLLSLVLFKKFINRFLLATIFSLSAGALTLTNWEISTRSQILMFFPFFLYLAFQITKFRTKFVILYILTAIMMLATHHFFYMALFYSCLIIIFDQIYKFNAKSNYIQIKKTQIWNINFNYVYVLICVLLVLLIFFFGTDLGLITAGSRYTWILNIATITGRNVGLILFLAAGGFTYFVFKNSKSFEEWVILVCLIPTLLFSFNQTYGYMSTYLFVMLLGSVGYFNIIKNWEKHGKITAIFIILILTLNVSFSAFFEHYRLGLGGGYTEWYMREETYSTGEWVRNHISEDKIAIENGFECERMFASYGGKPIIYYDEISNYINGFVTLDQQNITKNSPFSKEFYFDNPYVLNTGMAGVVNWISLFPVTDERVRDFVEHTNASYYFEDRSNPSVLFNSLQTDKNRIFDGGRMRLWAD
jgi:hypothetical protein